MRKVIGRNVGEKAYESGGEGGLQAYKRYLGLYALRKAVQVDMRKLVGITEGRR